MEDVNRTAKALPGTDRADCAQEMGRSEHCDAGKLENMCPQGERHVNILTIQYTTSDRYIIEGCKDQAGFG